MPYELKKEPKFDFSQIIGAAFLYFGWLMMLVSLHIGAINSFGNLSNILNTVFIIMLSVYIGLLIFGIVGIVSKLFFWMTWKIQTPEWQQKKVKGLE